MDRIAIVGAGLIGRAWAIVFARAGHPVAVYDATPARSRASLRAVDAALAELAEVRPARRAAGDGARRGSRRRRRSPTRCAGARYVQENVREDARGEAGDLRRDGRARRARTASSRARPRTFPPPPSAPSLPGRARCLVAHPVNPPHLVPVVEMCAGAVDRAGRGRARATRCTRPRARCRSS